MQGDMPPERRREAWELMLSCWLNEAQCWLKLGDHAKAPGYDGRSVLPMSNFFMNFSAELQNMAAEISTEFLQNFQDISATYYIPWQSPNPLELKKA